MIRLMVLGAVLVAVVGPPRPGSAQAPPFSNTLRYGSGYFEVPAAAVLPNFGVRASYSGFWIRTDADPLVGSDGLVTGPGERRRSFHGDGVLALGLGGWAEVGTTLQSFSDEADGGRVMGLFAKLLLLDPAQSGLGLAVGGRWVEAPDFGDGVRRAPTRLGIPDARARAVFTDGRDLDTRLTLYGVGTFVLPGVEISFLPRNQVTASLGYGTGMLREGGDLPWYADGGWNGWFLAGSWDVEPTAGTVLSLKAEHTGFDVNVGGEVARGALRMGVHLLGANHDDVGAFRSRRVGFSLSLTACPLLRRACRPAVRTPGAADTVRLPAPPPDTVRIRAPRPDTARRGPSVHDPLEHPVEGVQDGDGGAPVQLALLARLGAQQAVVPPLGASAHGGDDHPRVEGAHRLHPHELRLHQVARHLPDGVQRGEGPHAQVPLTGREAARFSLDRLPTPLHPHGQAPLAVGRRVDLQAQETESAPGGL
ncbi:MAG: hypothetical protein RQ751_12040 [Longimicrobiales bacterium]|nr:hypothetical protein [Longimicrobiales bacterium]